MYLELGREGEGVKSHGVGFRATMRAAHSWYGLTVSTAAGALLLVGCATTPPVKPWPLESLVSARDGSARVWGSLFLIDQGLINTPPEDSAHLPIEVRGGVAPAIALFGDLTARDLILEADVAFVGNGAPGLVFRVIEEEGVIRNMFSLAIHANGMNLWYLDGGRWILLSSHVLSVAPSVRHTLRVDVRAARITAYLDGEKVIESRQPAHVTAGKAGIRAGEGLCIFYAVSVSESPLETSTREAP